MSPADRRVAGFTLIELMIAMVLGLIVIAGVVSVFLAGQQSFRTNNALADVQDSSRIAFELMARDIREAGMTGCNSTNGNITNVLNGQSTTWWTNWANATHGYADATTDPALSGITGFGAPVAGTSSLQLISADTDVGALSADYDDSAASFTTQTPAPAYAAGDVVMLCSPGHASIVQLSSFNTSTGVATFVAGTSPTPGNSSTDLTFPAGSGPCSTPDLLIRSCFPANSLVSKLTAVDWYIGTNPVGGDSLYRVNLVNNGTGTVATPQEMVRNVTGMTITYLDPSASAISDKYVPASTITADNGWSNVTAVQVALTMQSTFTRASVTGTAPLQRQYSFTTTLRNRVN